MATIRCEQLAATKRPNICLTVESSYDEAYDFYVNLCMMIDEEKISGPIVIGLRDGIAQFYRIKTKK